VPTGRSSGFPKGGADKFPNWLEIDLSAIRRNLAAVGGLIGEGCRILAVIKSEAYGHGALPVARAAIGGGAWGLCAASLSEARRLRRGGITAPILLLNSGPPQEAGEIVRLNLTQALYSRQMAQALSAAAAKVGALVEAHIKIDTGMGRLGILPEEADKFASEAAALPGLQIAGVFSHLATAEESDPSYAFHQFARFRGCLERMGAHLPGLKAHIANSAAALRFPWMRLDFVRIGLLVYGVYPTAEGSQELRLQPALAWKTRIAFLKSVPAGFPVSYGRTWRAPSSTTLATLPVGYADGYPRSLSNRGQVLFRGRLCPVVGTICMNHTLIDLGDEAGPSPGEEVVLIGPQGENRLTVNHLAEWAQTVPHEILARLGSHLPRLYLG